MQNKLYYIKNIKLTKKKKKKKRETNLNMTVFFFLRNLLKRKN